MTEDAVSAPRTEELRQRLRDYDAARKCWGDGQRGADQVLAFTADEMREALAVLEEQNRMLTRENARLVMEVARREHEAMDEAVRCVQLGERVRLLEAQVEEARLLAETFRGDMDLIAAAGRLEVRIGALPWETSLGGSSPAPQKEEPK